MGSRPAACGALAALLLLAAACQGAAGQGAAGQGAAGQGDSGASPPQAAATPADGFVLPSLKGLNYGTPGTVDGSYVGTSWLRSGPGTHDEWASVEPRLRQDLDFIASHRLGKVQRVFIGLDQLMVWDPSTGFVRFNDASLDNFQKALDLFQAHDLKMIAVVYDQEETSNPGNFDVQALDGQHPAMRENYLRATEQFFRRFGASPTVVGWDLFNEAYNSLGASGGLPKPPAEDPTSPNYSDATIHAWIRDLYQSAKRGAPGAWLTVSDTTELYWKDHPDTSKYDDSVDFYDIHVYDSKPKARDWSRLLHKPYMLGEVAADYPDGFKNQSTNAHVVGWWLSHARALGIRAVLAHASGKAVYSLQTGKVTSTGQVIEAAR